jgi:hypothetical protein
MKSPMEQVNMLWNRIRAQRPKNWADMALRPTLSHQDLYKLAGLRQN